MSAKKSALVVKGPDGPRPFMRGILVQSLTSRGIPFETALETATAVRDQVAKRRSVSLPELATLVEQHLPPEYDLDAIPLRAETPHVVDVHGEGSPFSKGILSVSLQGAGLEPSDAYDVARELEEQFLREGKHEIDRDTLRDQVAITIERTHGARAAERYRTLRAAREDEKPVFLLIGGSSGVGKTSIAVEVARRLEISHVIGTDSIRQVMRLMFSQDLMPEIHSSTFDAHEALGLVGPDAVVGGFREQAQKIAVGVHALLDRAAQENYSIVVEGANLLPGVIDLERYRERAHVISLVVAGLNEKAYRGRLKGRAATARARRADRYLARFDEILAIQDHVLAEAEVYGTPIIDNVQLDDAVLSVIRSVLATLFKSLPISSEGKREAEDKAGP